MTKLEDSGILACLPTPKSPEPWISTPDITRKLNDQGCEVRHVKTVQRRLENLASIGVVDCQERGKALLWQRKEGANGFAAKAAGLMTFDEALALQILKRFASRQIPTLVTEVLDGLFGVAQARLEKSTVPEGMRYASWQRKVTAVDGAFQLQSPTIPDDIFPAVSRSLFLEQLLEIEYHPRSAPGKNVKPQTVMPLGLVEVGGNLVYLVARPVISGEAKPNQAMYRLDRMRAAKVLPDPFSYPSDFELWSYVEKERRFDYFPAEEAKVVLRFLDGTQHALLETPLSRDQTIENHSDGSMTVTGHIVLSQRFRWWLRAYGPYVEVIEPQALRAEFAEEAKLAYQLYDSAVA